MDDEQLDLLKATAPPVVSWAFDKVEGALEAGRFDAERIATALGQDDRSIGLLHHIAEDQRLLVRFDVMRRMFGGNLLGAGQSFVQQNYARYVASGKRSKGCCAKQWTGP